MVLSSLRWYPSAMTLSGWIRWQLGLLVAENVGWSYCAGVSCWYIAQCANKYVCFCFQKVRQDVWKCWFCWCFTVWILLSAFYSWSTVGDMNRDIFSFSDKSYHEHANYHFDFFDHIWVRFVDRRTLIMSSDISVTKNTMQNYKFL